MASDYGLRKNKDRVFREGRKKKAELERLVVKNEAANRLEPPVSGSKTKIKQEKRNSD
jgi:hypothetical protein